MTNEVIHIQFGGAQIRVRCGEPRSPNGIRIFPCEGEYPVYHDGTYDVMNLDETCEKAYLDAITALVPGKVVLDIGTGRDANWAIAAVRAGARRVYAVEVLPEWAEAARKTVEKRGMSEVITVVTGVSTDIALPEPIDVCVSEIIGSIGGSEGAAASLRDARTRLMTPCSISIPERCTTGVAGISLAEHHPDGIAFDAAGIPTLLDIFTAVGHPFDVRLSMEGPIHDALATNVAEVEDQRFNGDLVTEGRDRVRLTVEHECLLHGLALWPRLQALWGDMIIDPVQDDTSWLPVFAPLFPDGVGVAPGDVLEFDFAWSLSDDGRHPDYRATGRLTRPGRCAVPFDWDSPHHVPCFRTSETYRRLFPVA